MQRNTIIIGVVLVAILAGIFFWSRSNGIFGSSEQRVYSGPAYGLSFNYPQTYVQQESDFGTGASAHHSIAIVEQKALANTPVDGEYPPAIAVQIFPNPQKKSVTDWVKETTDSNYKLSEDGALESGEVGGRDAVSYIWDGLYRGESVVVAHKGNIIMLSVTSLSEGDEIRTVFTDLIDSITLY